MERPDTDEIELLHKGTISFSIPDCTPQLMKNPEQTLRYPLRSVIPICLLHPSNLLPGHGYPKKIVGAMANSVKLRSSLRVTLRSSVPTSQRNLDLFQGQAESSI